MLGENVASEVSSAEHVLMVGTGPIGIHIAPRTAVPIENDYVREQFADFGQFFVAISVHFVTNENFSHFLTPQVTAHK